MSTVNTAPRLKRRKVVADAHGARPWDDAIQYAKQQTGGLDRFRYSEAAAAIPRALLETMAMVSCRQHAGNIRTPALDAAPG